MLRKSILMALALGFASVGLAAPAFADAADNQFLNDLANNNVQSSKGDAALIAAGHEVCAGVNSGKHPLEYLNGVSVSSQYDVANLVVAALKAYCPQNAYMIEDILAEPGMAGNVGLGPNSAINRFEEEDRQRQREVMEGPPPGCNTSAHVLISICMRSRL